MKHTTQTILRRPLGFSLVEMLGVILILGVIASAGYGVFSNLNSSVKDKKLNSEVATLNSAVSTYLGFGGNLDSVESPEEALAHLRSIADSDLAERIPGLSASMVDPRIAAVKQTDAEAQSDEKRVHWNATSKRFEIATSGEAGLSSFYLDQSDTEFERPEETREFAVLYASEDDWVWDYTETVAVAPAGPTQVATYDPITITTNPPPPSPQSDDDDGGPQTTPLAAPIFSTPGGAYSIRDYDMGITLTNPNPGGTSDIYIQRNHGPWERYSPGTTLMVTPDDFIAAQIISTSPEWTDSSRVDESFAAEPVQLNPPTIIPSSPNFGIFDDRVVSVVLENTNGDDPATMQYRIDNGPWLDYEGMFLLDRADYDNGAQIHARAISDNPYYLPSSSNFELVAAEPLTLAGGARGEFQNAIGGPNMVTNLDRWNPTNDYFAWGATRDRWGRPVRGTSQSWMEFEGGDADDIILGERFLLGDLAYYNGTILSGSGAESVDFGLDLTFDIGGTTIDTSFDYEFELINTRNTNDAWASADYVRMDRPNSGTFFNIGDAVFELVLEFGETTSNGFSTFDEFHVQENRQATSNLYATIYDRTPAQENNGKGNGKGKGKGKGQGNFDDDDDDGGDDDDD